MQGAMAEIPLRQKPSEYFKQQCFISVDVDESLVRNVIDTTGDDNIVISTDYPHIDCRWPHALDEFLSIPISEQSKRKILWDNCARLYGVS
jgi:predicted TIM-barrel fold metal-dependent hydrolase